MKWVLFLLSLIALFFANNTLFLVPEKYDSFTAVAASTAILTAGVLAWFSSKKFARSTLGTQATWKNVVMAPPAVIWIFVVVLFCFFGLMKIAAYR
jgi:uncharacterized membrane protein